MAKIDGERQRNALIALKALAGEKGITGDNEGIDAAIKTIAWLEANRDVVELAMLIKKEPAVKAVVEEFNARIVGVRSI